MNQKRKLIFILLSTIVLLFGALYILPQLTKEKIPLSIHLKWLHQAQFAGIYTAQEKKLYEQEGLMVTIKEGGPKTPPIPAVLSGDADFGIAGADDLLVAISQGSPIIAVAAIYQTSPVVYFSLIESGIHTPFDFSGKKVGFREGTGTYYSYVAMLNNLHIDRNSITEIPVGTDLTLLFEKKVDVMPGFRTNEPKIAEEKGFKVILIKPEDYGINIYADVLFTRTSMLQKHPDAVRSFVHATILGWDYALRHENEAIDYTMKYAHSSTRDHQLFMLKESIPLIKPNEKIRIGFLDTLGMERTYELMKKFKLIKNEFDVTKAYTNDFLP